MATTRLVPSKVVCIASGAQSRDALVEQHLYLVPPIAGRIHRTLPPSFEVGDLIATGNLELVRTASRFKPKAHGYAPFSAFARPRIRGAILDSVRRRFYTDATHKELDQGKDLPVNAGIEICIDQGRRLKVVAAAFTWLSPLQAAILESYYSPRAVKPPSFVVLGKRFGMTGRDVNRIKAEAIEIIRARIRIAA